MPNRLAAETSPYLRQHADNPVDWHPWGDEAFARAGAEDKPVLLSVGYSACHWCHVMAHESFENPEIASLMNQLFINIKVDREERPDVDGLYMQAVLAISGQGGWPMTVFLTPHAEPYFGGTYFPPEDRHGLRGFPYVLRAAASAYHQRRHDVQQAAEQLRSVMTAPSLPRAGEPSEAHLQAAGARLLEQTDMEHGGFGGAPKFPQPGSVDLLLRRHRSTRESAYWQAAEVSLDAMSRGGVCDQLAGGFHRYAVDGTWSVPHFEKMLYDNAQLALVYLHAFQLTGEVRWRTVVEGTLDYLLREMRLPDGGFASSQDADSPGGEGAYFVWTPQQITDVVGSDDGDLALRIFGVTAAGNFEGGRTVLHQPRPLEQLAAELGMTGEQLRERTEALRARLLEARARRPAPARDDKVLTSWNALAIAALAEAGVALQRDDYLQAARQCADFLLHELRPNDVLLRTWKDGQARITGFLEDSALLADALISLGEAMGSGHHVREARRLIDDALRRYRGEDGSFYDTAGDAPALLVRPRTLDDNPLPAGQSALAGALLRLAALTGDASYRDVATDILSPLAAAIARSPLSLSSLAAALDRALAPSREIAIVGPAEDPRTRGLVAAAHARWRADAVLAWGDADDVELLADRPLVGGAPAAYVCQGFVCTAPVTDVESLSRMLDAPIAAAAT